jgi:Sensors of blue-light using FAD
VKPFSTEELTDLLRKSRDNNAALGITGMLLYKDGNFMQVLEGDEERVRALATKVSQDRRHRGFIQLELHHGASVSGLGHGISRLAFTRGGTDPGL